jgi:hypothetical protein
MKEDTFNTSTDRIKLGAYIMVGSCGLEQFGFEQKLIACSCVYDVKLTGSVNCSEFKQ